MEKKPYSDSRWWDNPAPKEVQCNRCKHYRLWAKCDAFPDGIPKELMTADMTHIKPYDGDNGIRYEKDPNYIPPPDFTKK